MVSIGAGIAIPSSALNNNTIIRVAVVNRESMRRALLIRAGCITYTLRLRYLRVGLAPQTLFTYTMSKGAQLERAAQLPPHPAPYPDLAPRGDGWPQGARARSAERRRAMMTSPHRTRLPNRRRAETHELAIGNLVLTATIGFDARRAMAMLSDSPRIIACAIECPRAYGAALIPAISERFLACTEHFRRGLACYPLLITRKLAIQTLRVIKNPEASIAVKFTLHHSGTRISHAASATKVHCEALQHGYVLLRDGLLAILNPKVCWQ
jgi:hypothetical protein